jgi:adenylate kinase family enzyme
MAARVYITGAAGSGTSSLGRALALRAGVPHLDTDDFYWAPTDPPFTSKRPVEERLALIAAAQLAQGPQGGWVLSGSADGWGEVAIEGAGLILFLQTPTPVRLMRIRKREAAKFGDRVKPGGDMYHNHAEFLKWAAGYDEPYFGGRSLQRHRDWLAGRPEPVLELSGAKPVEDLLAAAWWRMQELGLV